MKPRSFFLGALLIATIRVIASAQQGRPDSVARNDTVHQLAAVNVTAARVSEESRTTTMQRLTLPATASITASKARESINVVDAEDAVKYLPSVFIRKRNNGDTQATLATRVWGVSSSARSLIFADGVPITALIANNNTIGGPRWGLVSPEEIARIDLMYGPFSAAYAGNSMGAVMEITTRMPSKLEGSLTQTQAEQTFDLYGTSKTYGTSQTNAHLGDRFGKFSFWASGNFQDSHSQPLLYVTSPTIPTGTTGGFADSNKLGAPANVLGATGLLHTDMAGGKLKAAYDFTPWMRAAYTFGFWRNDASSSVDTYIEKSGAPTFAGQSGFASGHYDLTQNHFSHALSIRTDTRRDWDFEANASLYRMGKDQQRTPLSVSSSDATFSQAGRVAVLDGTNWSNVDVKGAWHRGGPLATHSVTFGAHLDRYRLSNPTYNTSDWRSGGFGSVATEGDGTTRTEALWAQDRWFILPTLSFTFGGRWENWHAYDGFNASGSTTVTQPSLDASRFSPKAVLSWLGVPDWTFTASVGKAYRFATPAELYQLVSTGATFTSPDPNLKPDNDLSAELRVERQFERGSARVSVFQDDVHDAIISQYRPLVPNSPTLYQYVSNVDHVRAKGVELSFDEHDLGVHRLDLSGSATYLDARTLALSGRASATAPAGSAIGKFLPNIPMWRASFLASYRATDRVTTSLAGRYSGKLYTTLDDADVHFNTYQGFSEWFVMDARANYRIDRHWSASLGVDNLLNRKYFLFHPFPQRTFVVDAKLSL
jgi:iron complex outermembrane receptor protein